MSQEPNVTRLRPFKIPVVFALSLAVGVGGCLDPFTLDGKACESNADCPIPYACLQQSNGERACFGGDAPAADGGSNVPLVTPDYCHDAKPVLDQFCTGTCHSTVNTSSGRTDFRLDVYANQGTVLGAKSKASAIRSRSYVTRDMPPPASPMPTNEQRKILADWVQGGAPECRPDAGM
jgi:hypothetical protein